MKYVKAIIAAATAGVSSLVSATADGSGVSLNEGLIATVATLTSLGLVYAVPNRP